MRRIKFDEAGAELGAAVGGAEIDLPRANSMPLPSNDLDAALAFVIERISQEAERSGTPLGNDEKHFLNHLPTQPTNPIAVTGFNTAYKDTLPTPILRDFGFERLCKLAKDAHRHDIRTRPDAVPEWEFAAAMSWLLGWAGVRTKKRPARWDRLLLVTTATFVVVLFLVGAFALSALTDGMKGLWRWALWGVGACVYGSVITLVYFSVRRLEVRQQESNIERCRRDLPVRGSAYTSLK
jgi:hypothetical protein